MCSSTPFFFSFSTVQEQYLYRASKWTLRSNVANGVRHCSADAIGVDVLGRWVAADLG